MRLFWIFALLLAGCLVEPKDTASGEVIASYNREMLTFWGTVLTGGLLFLGQLVTMWMNSRNAKKIENVDAKVQEVKVATDGMKTELVKVTNQKANLEGREEGRIQGVQSEKDRHQENGTTRTPRVPVPPQVVVVQMPATLVAPAAPNGTPVVTPAPATPSGVIPAMEVQAPKDS